MGRTGLIIDLGEFLEFLEDTRTIEEIKNRFDVSAATANKHVNKLVEEGIVKRQYRGKGAKAYYRLEDEFKTVENREIECNAFTS